MDMCPAFFSGGEPRYLLFLQRSRLLHGSVHYVSDVCGTNYHLGVSLPCSLLVLKERVSRIAIASGSSMMCLYIC